MREEQKIGSDLYGHPVKKKFIDFSGIVYLPTWI